MGHLIDSLSPRVLRTAQRCVNNHEWYGYTIAQEPNEEAAVLKILKAVLNDAKSHSQSD